MEPTSSDTGTAIKPERTKIFPLRRVAVLEMLVFFAAVLGYDYAFGEGVRFLGTALHPFWIILLLVSAQYGPNESVLCALLASVLLLVGNLPEQRITETMYAYLLRTAHLPFLWMVTALVLGGIRGRELQTIRNLKEKSSRAEISAEAIADAYGSLRHTKDYLEMRLAEERSSVATVFRAAQVLDNARPETMLDAVAQMVRVTLNPLCFSIYRLEPTGLTLFYTEGNCEIKDDFIPNESALFQSVIDQKLNLCITSSADEELLAGAIMAGAIYGTDNTRPIGMLRIEDMKFTELSLRSIDNFRILCLWIGRAVETALSQKDNEAFYETYELPTLVSG